MGSVCSLTQNMQKMGSDTQPVGICRRLIGFVISLLSRSKTPGSEEGSQELPSPKNRKDSNISPNKPNDHSDSEIEVEFRHTTSSRRWKQIDELGELIQSSERDDLLLNHNHWAADTDHSPHTSNGEKTGGKGLPELDPLPMMDDGLDAPVKSEIVIEEANFQADEAVKSHTQHHETRQRRRFGPLFSVVSNINEKSDAYIDSRKKAMHRNYTLDTKKP